MVVFLENALGFLTQFFPCALMIFLPFSEEDCRFGRRSVFAGITAGSVLMSIVFSAVLCLRDMERYPEHVAISNFLMTAAVLAILAVYVWLVRQSVVKKFAVFFVVLFYAAAVFFLVNVIYYVFFSYVPEIALYPYTSRFLLLYLGVTALMLPIMLGAVIHPLREYIQKVEPGYMKREFLAAILSTVAYFAGMVYLNVFFGGRGMFAAVFLPMVLLTVSQIFIYWLIFRESVRRKQDSDHQRAMEIRQLQYEMIVGDMENTLRMRHDLHHHYNVLNDLLQEGKLDEMKEYLSEVIDTTVRRENNEIYCENVAVNGLLQYYIGHAEAEKIHCQVQAKCGELAIEPADLTVLLGNAMENAIKACLKCPGPRSIRIEIGTVQDSLVIEILNSCESVQRDRRFRPEKGFLPAEAFLSDRAQGGYGLKSITHTAQKYGGSAEFSFDGEKKMFTARIRMNMRGIQSTNIC